MNIDKLGESTGPQAGQTACPIDTTRRPPVAESNPLQAQDHADMSMIGRLMARNLRALADSEDVRPEVLGQHQETTRQNTRFDNNIIDRIFRRMR